MASMLSSVDPPAVNYASVGRFHGSVCAVAHKGAPNGAQEESRFGDLRANVGQEAIEFPLDHLVALAGAGLHSRAIEHADPAALVANQSGVLEFSRGLGDAFAAHPQHV